ncbi:MAG: hypothetical protein ACK6EB_07460, partial [Planctomyces sp.]
ESGVVVQEIELGSILLKIAIGRQALSSTESELRQQRDQRKALLQDLKDKNAAIGTVDDRPGRIEEFDEHIEVLEDRVTRIKQDLNNDEKRLRQRASKQDAEMYLAMKAE